MPYANTEAMNAHLAEIGRTVSPGAHALLVLDGAGWHSANALVIPPNITLLTLPPYSPELNPVENIWNFLRQNRLANRVLDTDQGDRRCLLRGVERAPRRPRARRLHHSTQLGAGQRLMPLA